MKRNWEVWNRTNLFLWIEMMFWVHFKSWVDFITFRLKSIIGETYQTFFWVVNTTEMHFSQRHPTPTTWCCFSKIHFPMSNHLDSQKPLWPWFNVLMKHGYYMSCLQNLVFTGYLFCKSCWMQEFCITQAISTWERDASIYSGEFWPIMETQENGDADNLYYILMKVTDSEKVSPKERLCGLQARKQKVQLIKPLGLIYTTILTQFCHFKIWNLSCSVFIFLILIFPSFLFPFLTIFDAVVHCLPW